MLTKFFSTDTLPTTFGERLPRPGETTAPTDPGRLQLKPNLFLDKVTGRMSYEPPLPDVPPKPVIDETVWKDEPPAEAGWYIASSQKNTTSARYWHGAHWGQYVMHSNSKPRDEWLRKKDTVAPEDSTIYWLRAVGLPAA